MNSVRLETKEAWLFPELCDVVRLFFGDISISPDEGETHIAHASEINAESCVLDGRICKRREYACGSDALSATRERKRAAKNALFDCLAEVCDICPPWGSLTGIRPTRLMYEALSRGLSTDAAEEWLKREFRVSSEKTSLLHEIIDMQRGLIYPKDDEFDLYIGIPFCVTRCAYCSFSSGEIGNGSLTQPYVEALLREISEMGAFMRNSGMKLRAGYVGGGTPTSISARQLESVLNAAMREFDGAKEWTVEAGRPDTIDVEKLDMLKSCGVGRISVNPQTFSDATLRLIGRNHTSADTFAAFELARRAGFSNINMDIIAALPDETMDDFANTVTTVKSLNPESVTVHSLAIKRGSKLHEYLTVNNDPHNQAGNSLASDMVNFARRELEAGGWLPYYLYRQKYMAGNLENVGYARRGHACLYNVGNMEETSRVLALGAGAITKWLFPRERRIERTPNVRNIGEYISRVDEMCARKRALLGGASDNGQEV